MFWVAALVFLWEHGFVGGTPYVGVDGGYAYLNWTISNLANDSIRLIRNPANNGSLMVFDSKAVTIVDKRATFTGDLSRGIVSFTLSNVTLSDAGMYTFILFNASGNLILGGQVLVVAESPNIPVVIPLFLSAVVGQEYKLNCSTESRSAPLDHNLTMYSEWKKNGVNTTMGTGYSVNGTILTISNLSRNENGDTVTCRAFEDQRRISTESSAFDLNVFYGPDNVKITPSGDLTVNEGGDMTLNCTGECNPPCGTYNWRKESPPTLVVSSQSYSIPDVRRNHSGIYSCIVTNMNISRNATAQITLMVNYGPDAGNITLSPNQTFELAEFSNLSVSCSANCYPFCEYRWTGPGIDDFRNTTELFISHIRRGQAGVFQCIATNPAITNKSATANISVTVFYGPDAGNITLSPYQTFERVEFSALSVNCSADCYRNCQYRWTGPGLNENGNTGVLSILNITRQQDGVFTCTATNPEIANKSATANINVTVLYGPDSPLQLYPVNTSYRLVEGVTLPDINCTSSCFPSCEFNWTGPVPSLTGVISLGKVNRSVRGNYTCSGRNPSTQTLSKSSVVTVIVIYGPETPVLTPNTTAYTLNESNILPNIQCSSECFPGCTSYWYKEQTIVPGIQADMLSLGDVYRNDSGTYACRSKNMESNITREKAIQLVVQYGPDSPLQLYPVNTSYRLVEGTTLPDINCTSSCFPSCEFHWTGPVPSLTGVISLGKVNRSVRGNYMCSGRNIRTQTLSNSSVVTVIIIYGPDAPVLTPSSTEHILNESNILPNISCSSECVPGCTSYWYKRQTKVPVLQADMLSLGDVYRNDSGEYVCKSTNMESNVTREKVIQLVVQYPPTVSIESRNGSFSETGFMINCTAHGIPERYIFSLIHSSLFSGIKIRHLVDNHPVSTGVLVHWFRNTSFMDTGVYTCIASNGILDYRDGSLHKNVSETVWVTGPPTVISSDTEFYAEKGESGRLLIGFYNSLLLDANVTWNIKKNQTLEKLENSNKYNITIASRNVTVEFYSVLVQQPGFITTLEIKNVTEEDFSTYQVFLQNSVGNLSDLTLNLMQRGRPDVPMDVHIVPNSITSSSVNIEWVSGFHGGSNQTFVIEYSAADERWTNYSHDVFGGMMQNKYFNITVEDLHQNTLYFFQLYAWNVFGRSVHSTTINATTYAEINKQGINDKGAEEVIIGGVVGVVVLLSIGVTIIIILYRRRRVQKQHNNGTRLELDARSEDINNHESGLQDNPLYATTVAEYAAVVKPKINAATVVDPSNIYAEVDKTNKNRKKGDVYENIDLKGKSITVNSEYENSRQKRTETSDGNVYENPGNVASKSPLVNKDGLLYADLMLDPPTNKNGKVLIRGIENRTEYADIAYGKRGQPLPDYNEENVDDGKK